MKSAWKADFTYFPSAENKARFGDYFSKSKWIKSSMKECSDFADLSLVGCRRLVVERTFA